MGEPTLGMIYPWALNYAPQGYLFCQGQTLQVKQYAALFSLLSNTYGGDGVTTFMLPDLRGRIALGMGAYNANGVSANYVLGKTGGTEGVTLTADNIAPHTHGAIVSQTGAIPLDTTTTINVSAVSASNGSDTPSAAFPSIAAGYTAATDPNTGANADVFNFSGSYTNIEYLPSAVKVSVNNPNASVGMQSTGGGQPHNNMQPFLALNFIICIVGYYPQRP